LRSIEPAIRLEGELRVPGDKSISHRALLVGALGEGPYAIRGLSPAADVASSARAVASLGVRLSNDSESLLEGWPQRGEGRDSQILVESPGWGAWNVPGEELDVGNSGTTIRLLLGCLAPSSVRATLTGDESIKRRPMRRVVDRLRRMGARIEGEDGGDRAPLTVTGADLTGADHELDVASAQIKSALLLAGLRAGGSTSVREPSRSRDHTERLLRYLGVHIDESKDRLIVKATDIRNRDLQVPGDLSSAAFLLVGAAILPGSDVSVPGVGINPTRAGILEILRRYGASVDVTDEHEVCGEPVGTVRVRAGDRRALEVSGALVVEAIDELPLVAVLGAFADGGTTVVRDAAELRVKESNRVRTVADGLRAAGVEAETSPDGFAVRGVGGMPGGVVSSAGDHRIAMAFAVAGLGSRDGVTVEGWDAVGVSYPGFGEDLDRLAVR
jgi:3-phosphoshikimate 1-carboxyvinyltransferase